ncbi:MAG: hypothetical protein ACHQ50_10040 [Fimbriimonadales bacterium]
MDEFFSFVLEFWFALGAATTGSLVLWLLDRYLSKKRLWSPMMRRGRRLALWAIGISLYIAASFFAWRSQYRQANAATKDRNEIEQRWVDERTARRRLERPAFPTFTPPPGGAVRMPATRSPRPSGTPSISQHSEGPNSPNIVGDSNTVNVLAQPNILSLAGAETSEKNGAYIVRLWFATSKDEPIGKVVLTVGLDPGVDGRIIDFWPDGNAGAYLSGEGSKSIVPSGDAARLIYSPLPGVLPVVDLTITKLVPFVVEGTHNLKPMRVIPRVRPTSITPQ